MKRSRKLFRLLFKVNLIKTVWFNWKMLPARQAWRLPVWFFGKTTFRGLTGKVIIESRVRSGMIRVGENAWYVETTVPWTIWNIRGTMVFKGPLEFCMGSYVLVSDQAVLTLGKNRTGFGSNIRLFCFDRITIGDSSRFAWDCLISDTSFHYIEKIESGAKAPLTKPVIIGDRVSVFNRSSILKGAVLPDDTIVVSNSIVNKDFSKIGPYCMLAGAPAVVKATGVRRIWDLKEERELDRQFGYHRTHL